MTGQFLEEILPLSPLQKGLFFHSLYDVNGADVYTTQLVFALDGDLDEGRLKTAARALLERHATLRAAFVHEDVSQPVQVIAREVPLLWRRVDFSSSEEIERGRDLEKWLQEERERRFDLGQPPLLRFALIRLEQDQYRLVLTNHHILMDGWSMPVLIRELFELYEWGNEAELPRVTPYREYLNWIAAQDREAARSAWKQALNGLESGTRVSRAEKRAPTALPDRVRIEAPEELTEALTRRARERGLTLNTILQGAWGILLGQLTDREDVVFGITVAGRPAEMANVETMVGLFINTIPLRMIISAEEGLGDVLTRLQDHQSRLMDSQHLSLTEIQELAGSGELFDTLFVFENYPTERKAVREQVSGLRIRAVGVRDTAHYPLTLIVVPRKRLQFRLEYRSELFERGAVDGIAARLIRVLEVMAADLEQRIGQIDLLGAEERQKVLKEWNDTASPIRPATLAELFEDQVTRTPSATAVCCGANSLTYSELNKRANRLAWKLHAAGVGPGELVAVGIDRSVEMVVAVMAVLKAGAAYVPIDLDYPILRIEEILTTADTEVIITGPGSLSRLAAVVGKMESIRHIACLGGDGHLESGRNDRLWNSADIEGSLDVNLAPKAGPDDLAYVIFTSGTTGRPKGVMLAHRPVVNVIDWLNKEFQVGRGDRVLCVASLCFDLSVYDIFGLLGVGGSIEIASQDQIRDPEALMDLLQNKPVTIWDSVPAVLQQLAPLWNEAGVKRDAKLRLVLLSGDWIPVTLPDRIRARFDRAAIIAMGGATEAAIWSNRFRIENVDAAWPSIPYGKPITNAAYYVLDRNLRPAPVGVSGNLYIGSKCLASGYLKNPVMTANRFVADPHGEPGARMYWTGDLARWKPDGNLEFLGRTDAQVKLRGFRIELGEIEARLAACEGVRDAIVVARQDERGNQSLVAYYTSVSYEQGAPRLEQLKSRLSQTLPDYMVPAAYVRLDGMPLTANGKLDRESLPAPGLDAFVMREYEEPLGETEQAVVRIWKEVLNVERVGRLDNFFHLGGHSMLALTIVERMRRVGLRVDVRTLFIAPTVAALALAARPLETTIHTPANGIPEGTEVLTPEMLPLVELSAEDIERIVYGVSIQGKRPS